MRRWARMFSTSCPLHDEPAAGYDPFDHDALEFRRKSAIEYLGNTIFIDREHGARVAARVLASTPMPVPGEKAMSPFRCTNSVTEGCIRSNKTNEVRRK